MNKRLVDEIYLAADSVLSPEVVAFLRTEKTVAEKSKQFMRAKNDTVALDEYEQAMLA